MQPQILPTQSMSFVSVRIAGWQVTTRSLGCYNCERGRASLLTRSTSAADERQVARAQLAIFLGYAVAVRCCSCRSWRRRCSLLQSVRCRALVAFSERALSPFCTLRCKIFCSFFATFDVDTRTHTCARAFARSLAVAHCCHAHCTRARCTLSGRKKAAAARTTRARAREALLLSVRPLARSPGRAPSCAVRRTLPLPLTTTTTMAMLPPPPPPSSSSSPPPRAARRPSLGLALVCSPPPPLPSPLRSPSGDVLQRRTAATAAATAIVRVGRCRIERGRRRATFSACWGTKKT